MQIASNKVKAFKKPLYSGLLLLALKENKTTHLSTLIQISIATASFSFLPPLSKGNLSHKMRARERG